MNEASEFEGTDEVRYRVPVKVTVTGLALLIPGTELEGLS